MGTLLRYVPAPSWVKVFAWCVLPLLYFIAPEGGVQFGAYQISRIVVAVACHLPFLMVVSLVNLLRHRGRRDTLVMVAVVAFSMLTTLAIVGVLISSNDPVIAKHILSVQAALFVFFHVWTYWYPEVLRDYYAWPWARLPKGIRAAGIIRALGHLFVLLANQVAAGVLPDAAWVVVAALLPMFALTLADAATVSVLFAMGLRPRGYDDEEPDLFDT